ncbi:hypothetical protein BUALT_Bualt03G0204100 [Buddleja alternifolia]|uniref:Uncharacterized protein n=1 Tax=Buddleja alternifolia TaxID=168488 RepID=A0AAV6Y275_9LAMI|nr:hypothetical protein BUALT_Bualt03G0204100 [Buddleja alternifolia]
MKDPKPPGPRTAGTRENQNRETCGYPRFWNRNRQLSERKWKLGIEADMFAVSHLFLAIKVKNTSNE